MNLWILIWLWLHSSYGFVPVMASF